MEVKIVVWYKGESTRVDSGAILGREHLSDIVISHPDVSRRHAEIGGKLGTLQIRDLGSTNGVWLDGKRLDSVPLDVGKTRVAFGPKESSEFVDIEVTMPAAKPVASQSREPTEPNVAPKAPASSELLPESSKPDVQPVTSEASSPTPSLNKKDLVGNLGQLSQIYQTGENRIVIGRSPECDFVVPDLLVSRRHAELEITGPSTARITDLGTHSGTYVNGVKVVFSNLDEGDLIEIGRIQLVLREGSLEQYIAYGLPIEANNLTVIVDSNKRILQDVSFKLPAGSLTAVVGPSGSGKSTLLKALVGQRPADMGNVLVGGRSVYDTTDVVSQRIGFVPQDDRVHENLTVRDALSFAARMRLPQDASREEIRQTVERVAYELGLSERLATKVKALSDSQYKRVSVGYELVGEPQALILDEPTFGLDPGPERELMANLGDVADRGTTTLVVTQRVQSVELCDQVVVLAPGGRLAFVGTPTDAAPHFGVSDFANVFSLLSSRSNAEWEIEFDETSLSEGVGDRPAPPSRTGSPAHGRSTLTDVWNLSHRYLRLLSGDKKRLALMTLQTPALAVLLAFVLSRKSFDPVPGSAQREYIVAVVLAITLLGGLTSIREIVKDRPVFRREFYAGVSSAAFVLSRWTVLTAIIVVQAVLLVVIASSRQESPLGEGVLLSAGWLELLVATAGLGIAGVGIGLVISAFVRDATMALILIPLVVIPSILFSGVVFPTSGRLGIEQLTYLNPIQWGSSAVASVIDLPASERCDIVLPPQPGGSVSGQAASCSNRSWSGTAGSQSINFLMQILFNFGLVGLTMYGARRSLIQPLRQ